MNLELFEPLVASIIDNYDYTKLDKGLLENNEARPMPNFNYWAIMQYMNNPILLKSCKLLLLVNTIFWLVLAIYFSFFEYEDNNNLIVIKILLFLESIFYFIALIGVIKKIKLIYLAAIILALGNTILSLTDQIDLSDIISLILSGVTFINLILIWKLIFKNNKSLSID